MAADKDRPSGRPARTYLICSSPRVGSNLVCDALAGFEGGGQPVEYFNPRSIEAYLTRIGADSLPRGRYLDYLFSRRRDGAGVLGMKIHHHQLVRIFPTDDDQRAFLTRFDAVLFLRRRNKVRQAISEARARASSVWYVEEAEHVDSARRASARYQGTAIAGCLTAVVADDSGWESLLAASCIPHGVMFYEDIIRDFPEALRGISHHLGLGLKVDGHVVPSTHRLGDGLNEIWEARFRHEIFGEAAIAGGERQPRSISAVEIPQEGEVVGVIGGYRLAARIRDRDLASGGAIAPQPRQDDRRAGALRQERLQFGDLFQAENPTEVGQVGTEIEDLWLRVVPDHVDLAVVRKISAEGFEVWISWEPRIDACSGKIGLLYLTVVPHPVPISGHQALEGIPHHHDAFEAVESAVRDLLKRNGREVHP